jgi:hypothetical protein
MNLTEIKMNTVEIKNLSKSAARQLRCPATVLALLVALGLASCGQKPADVASPPPTPAVAPTTPAKVNAAMKAPLSEAVMKLGVKPADATTCPPNALVKGTVTKKRGNIYQTSKSPDYAQVKPDLCFKDTATAEKAGFKMPK